MPTQTRPPGCPCYPALNDVNDEIRRLMDEPATRERAARYQELLKRWTSACSRNETCWTTAA
ncbi:hypothetical protein [Streptomyces sp. 049-1]|uniref:hypothetical protein n=1 Tax=Streptomyces sp. 049-1 TaxID=2789264 RepID=UPI003980ACB3